MSEQDYDLTDDLLKDKFEIDKIHPCPVCGSEEPMLTDKDDDIPYCSRCGA